MNFIARNVIKLFFIQVVLASLFSTIYALSECEILRNKYYEKLEKRRKKELEPIGYEFLKNIEKTEKIKKFIDTVAINHKELMYEALYNEKFGFYSSGKVILGSNDEKVSFVTHPETLSPSYGAVIAYHAYGMYRSMIIAKDLKPGEKFHVIELGAGNGTLANDFLNFIENCAEEEKKYLYKTNWQEFCSNVLYTIGELSPTLAEIQKQKNKKHIEREKMRVVKVDAREIDKAFDGKKVKGLFVSNELPDAFPVHKIVKRGDAFYITVAIATCQIKGLDKLYSKKQEIKRIIDKNNNMRKEFRGEMPECINKETNETIIFSKKDYFDLKESAASKGISIDTYITFYEKEVAISYFKELQGYVKRNINYLSNELYGTTWYINDGVETFMRAISNVLDIGFIMTIDYGFSTSRLKDYMQCLKRLGEDKIKFYPVGVSESIYKAPGDYDITTDLNFTDMALVGEDLGIEAIFYGVQNALCNHEIILSTQKSMYMNPFEIDTDALIVENTKYIPSKEFDKGSYYYNFKVLIQKTKNTKSSFKITAPSEKLF